VLIEKHWRKVTSRQIVDIFLEELNHCEHPVDMMPVICTSSLYLINIYRNKLFVLCAVAQEVSPLFVTEFMHRSLDVFAEYFNQVDEITIKDNFSTVYQLLEELCDNGFPLITESNSLKQMISPPSISNLIVSAVSGKSNVADVLPDGTVSTIPWRRKGVHYHINVIYFDVVEELHCIIGKNGQVVSSKVVGELVAQSKLSGMPDILVTLNDPGVVQDYSLHPCIRFSRFEKERVLSFVPPDGNFSLMKYSVDKSKYSTSKGNLSSLPIPIYCRPQVGFHESGGTVQCVVGLKNSGGGFSSNEVAFEKVENISVVLPFPKSTRSTDLKSSYGLVTIDEASKVCTWRIDKLPKDGTVTLNGSFSFASDTPNPEFSMVLLLEFKVPNYSVSGLKFNSFAIMNESYEPSRYLRSELKSGSIQIRV